MPELRDLPAIERLLQAAELAQQIKQHGTNTVKDVLRTMQADMRRERVVPEWAVQPQGYADAVAQTLGRRGYTHMFNLTGTVVHTNLGRALLSPELWRQIEPLITRPMNLEYDIDAGRRGDRDAVVTERLCRLTGCEAATIVNNNAAALMLVLNTFGLNREVPVSRGELVEIGGSFRLPELMSRAGCKLLEVGTTNRTRPSDFENVIDRASLLLKIHPSNYYIEGFTQSVEAADLAALGEKYAVPSCIDLGSGSLVDLGQYNLPNEPTPQSVLEQGIDLVTFSGDKLLGGVQAGIIAGKAELIEQIRKNPMKRALRADKITLAVLDATLKLYEHPEQLRQHLPLLQTLTLSQDELWARAEALAKYLPANLGWDIIESPAQIGSGALPDQTINSVAISLAAPKHSAEALAEALRKLPIPVIGRIRDEKVLLDMRGAEHLEELGQQLQSLPL